MENNKYLPIGASISSSYEVIDILGEDDFEILYLVRDIDRKGSFFVLKELFLETFSSRRDKAVYTLPEAEGVFNKRKKQIIEEIEAQKLNLNFDEIKVYGYEEDHGTIYTIMEFSNNASLEKYLQFTPKDAEHLPTLSELLTQKKKLFTLPFFLKVLLSVGFLILGAFYVYQFFQTSSIEEKLEASVSMHYPKLTDRTESASLELSPLKKKIELREPIINEKNVTEVNISVQNEIIEQVEKEENLTITKEENLTEILAIEVDINTTVDDINSSIKIFLDTYIEASAISEGASLKFYDKEVKRYFKFRNPTHKTIENSQKRYNKKWAKREFQILNFEIIKTYKKDKRNYYDVKTTTVWSVSNKGKKLSGKSRGFMTLKEVEDEFKITIIYTLK